MVNGCTATCAQSLDTVKVRRQCRPDNRQNQFGGAALRALLCIFSLARKRRGKGVRVGGSRRHKKVHTSEHTFVRHIVKWRDNKQRADRMKRKKSEKELQQRQKALHRLIWKLAAITHCLSVVHTHTISIVNVRKKEGKLPEIEVAIRLKQKWE